MNLLVDYIESICNEKKDKTAVIFDTETITYKELLNNSKKLGSYLLKNIKTNEPVIVFMDKSIIALESFFGVLFAGGCYSMVNPRFPEKRILQIKDTLECRCILTDNLNYEVASKIFKDSIIVNVQNVESEIDEKALEMIKDKKIDIDPVYINFTSGSTGTPKGVAVSNRSIIDFIKEFTNLFNINEEDIIANQAPFDFDVSVKDIYSTIFTGATLLIVPRQFFSNPTVLLDYLDNHKATTLIWAVSALCLITTFHGLDYKTPKNINKVIFSGEVMPLKHLNIWLDKLKKATFVNVYGPTEITCNCTYHIIDRNRVYEEIPIGKPFKNEKVFLLDEDDELVDTEEKVGEICVSGSCLSLGYFNNKLQTDKHYFQNPLNNKYIEYIYRTGDLGKYKDNELYFLGRKDFQIKHMGHRIELEEIDKAIMNVDKVIRSCSIYDSAKQRIYGFYIGSIDKETLKNELEKTLPIYMIPNKLVQVSDFPMTKNGKTDREALLKYYKELKS